MQGLFAESELYRGDNRLFACAKLCEVLGFDAAYLRTDIQLCKTNLTPRRVNRAAIKSKENADAIEALEITQGMPEKKPKW